MALASSWARMGSVSATEMRKRLLRRMSWMVVLDWRIEAAWERIRAMLSLCVALFEIRSSPKNPGSSSKVGWRLMAFW